MTRSGWIRVSAAGGVLALALTGCGAHPDVVTAHGPASAAPTAAPPGTTRPTTDPTPVAAAAGRAPAERTAPPPAAPADGSDAPATASAPSWSLLGTRWTAVSRTRASQPHPLLPGTSVDVDLGAARSGVIVWSAGCGRAGGDLVVHPDRLEVESTGGTGVSCGEQLDRQGDEVNAFFDADPAWQRDGEQLVLVVGDVVLRLRPAP